MVKIDVCNVFDATASNVGPSTIGGEWFDRNKTLPHARLVMRSSLSASGDDVQQTVRFARQFMNETLIKALPPPKRKRKSSSKKRALQQQSDEQLERPETKRKRVAFDLTVSPIFRQVASNQRVSFHNIIEDVTISVQDEYLRNQLKLSVPKTYELYNNSLYKQTIGQGDAVLKHLRESLDQFGFKRHSNQIHFHEEMVKACLRIVYRYDFEQNIDRVLRENNWKKMVQEVLIITARRIGKTTAVAIFAAALLMCVPQVELMIFSVSLNSSRKMLLMILDFLEGHPLGHEMIKRPTNKDKITLVGGPTDRRTCESRPGRGEVSLCILVRYSLKGILNRICRRPSLLWWQRRATPKQRCCWWYQYIDYRVRTGKFYFFSVSVTECANATLSSPDKSAASVRMPNSS